MAKEKGAANRPDQHNLTPCDFPDANQVAAAVCSASMLGIAICDAQLRFLSINDALAEMHGIPAEAHLGKTVSEVLGPAARQIEPKLELVFTTGESARLELAAQLPTRTEMGYWAASYFPIKDQEERVKQVCAIVTELTNRRKVELSLLGLSRKLLTLNAAVKRNIVRPGGTSDRTHNKRTQRAQLLVNLIDRCVAEIVAISKLPGSLA